MLSVFKCFHQRILKLLITNKCLGKFNCIFWRWGREGVVYKRGSKLVWVVEPCHNETLNEEDLIGLKKPA